MVHNDQKKLQIRWSFGSAISKVFILLARFLTLGF
jgi:hypothetical protein